MTFCAIDRDRFTYLLDLGTDEFELRRFFQDCRVQLIQRGARVQNVPHGNKSRVRVIVNELPPAADDVLRKWFAENITMTDPEDVSSVLETFRLHEEVGERLDESTARRFARSCLVHLFSESPPASLLEFLRAPINGVERPPERIGGPVEPPIEVEAASLADWDGLVPVLVALVQGHDLDKYLDGMPANIAGLLTGLQAAAKGSTKDAEVALESLPPMSRAREALEQYLHQQAARSSKEAPRGITVVPLEAFDGPYDHDQDEILAYCTKSDPPKAVFVHPMAVLKGNKAQKLDAQLRKELFPLNGDVMAFAGAANPRQPRRGEVGVWTVEEHVTDKATHFHLKSETKKVYEVFAVPFASTDYDSVREFLREHAQTRPGGMQQPLFALGDGVIVGPRPDRPDLTKEETYESGLLLWNTLPVLRLEGRIFCIGPLPKEHGVYECASLALSVRRLLRPYIGAGKTTIAGLTKGQLSDLVQYLASNESGLTVQRLQRIRAELVQIQEHEEALDELANDLLVHPAVKSRVDELVQQAVEDKASEKAKLQNEIGRLQKEREEWEGKVRRQKEEHKKLKDDTTKIVKAAFEKARRDGVGTLAELAVFQELTHSADRSTGVGFEPVISEFSRSEESVLEILAEYGVLGRRAEAFAAIGAIAGSTGLILSVQGTASRVVVERWARSIGKGILVDATVGLVSDAALKRYLNGNARMDVVAVLDANLSAIDVYARPILDSVIEKVRRPADGATSSVFISTSESVAHLPLPASVERLCLKLNLDKKYRFEEVDIEDLNQKAFHPEEGVLITKLWTPACKKLQTHISSLAPELQSSVLPILIDSSA